MWLIFNGPRCYMTWGRSPCYSEFSSHSVFWPLTSTVGPWRAGMFCGVPQVPGPEGLVRTHACVMWGLPDAQPRPHPSQPAVHLLQSHHAGQPTSFSLEKTSLLTGGPCQSVHGEAGAEQKWCSAVNILSSHWVVFWVRNQKALALGTPLALVWWAFSAVNHFWRRESSSSQMHRLPYWFIVSESECSKCCLSCHSCSFSQ